MESQLYEILNKRWKVTAKTLFGEDVGELRDYEEWLSENNRPTFSRKSSASGKDVAFVLPYYSQTARTLSLSELTFNEEFEPLNINEIKDIDSIVQALGERICYTGDLHLGNSKHIENSTDIIECFYVADSAQISFSKYIAHCYNMEYCENIFGTMNIGWCKYSIKLNNSSHLNRCFELYTTQDSSDCYYSHSIFNCKNCMFCFGLRSTNHAIGNLVLPQDRYLSLKKKLAGEMADELRRNRKLPTLMELVGDFEPENMFSSLDYRQEPTPSKETRPELVEDAFTKTASILFGRPLRGLESYQDWLVQFTRETKRRKSALSGKEIIVADHSRYFDFPENRLVSEKEAEAIGKLLRLDSPDLTDFSLKKAPGLIGKIAFFCPEMNYGQLDNLTESQVNLHATNCFRSILNLYSKNCAYNYYVLESESSFGCNSVRKSQFVVNCYLSSNLSRCFELDSSRDCSGSCYCHNCENVKDSMFCFNVKNKRHAVGNTSLPPGKFSGIKDGILEELGSTLEKEHRIPLSIFNLVEKRK